VNNQNDKFKKIEEVIKHKFINTDLLKNSLMHSSFANENKNKKFKSNERLEFLGDAILDLIISEKIYHDYPELAEGDMTKARANIVCSATLAKCARELDLGELLFMGKGEENTGGRARDSILSDVFEALLGAIYIDGGLEVARNFVLKQMERVIADAVNGLIFLDFKTQLQEIVQSKNIGKIVYEIIKEEGPDHNKRFYAKVEINSEISGTGVGKTKKEAEQRAAKEVIDKYL
jgi:ribonuclease-3